MTPTEIEVRTRYGDTVRADVYLPSSQGPYPVLLAASPYQKALAHLPVHPQYPFRESGPIEFYLRHGYAYVWMDVPGSGRSSGVWDPVSRREGEAIADVIEWLAAQDFSTGRIGMIGQSYFCWSQWNAARVRPPHLRTIVAFDGSTDLYRDWMYKGGIPDLGFGTTWAATVMLQHQTQGHEITGGGRDRLVPDMYAHPFDDEWHRRRAPFWELDGVDIPVLSIGNWAKGPLHMRGNVEGFRRVGGPKKLMLIPARSPWEVQTTYASEQFHEEVVLPWYEHHLKGVENGAEGGSAVRVFVQRAGRYRDASAWPPEGVTGRAFYLSSEASGTAASYNDGSLAEEPPVTGADSTSFAYPDPEWRVGTTSFDAQGRPDHLARILTFTSPPLREACEFTGDGVLELYASTDQEDFDVVARLSVVKDGQADGERMSRGWLRASHREEDEELTEELRPFHSHQRPAPVVPGEVYHLRVALLPMSFQVEAGERLRLEVSCGDSPMLEGRWFQWYGLKVGEDTYYHSRERASRLVLPQMALPAAR